MKCFVISFGPSSNYVVFNYTVINTILQRPTTRTITDLGVTFDRELYFGPHIKTSVSAPFRLCAFIVQASQDLTNSSFFTTHL